MEMSRIGRMPVAIPKNVTVKIEDGNWVTITGPKGTLAQQFSPELTLTQEDGTLTVQRPSDARNQRAQHGLARALLNNMVIGVTTGFTKKLQIEGVGYRAEKQGDRLVLQVGKSHPVIFEPSSKTISFEVDRDGRGVTVSGIDKGEVGQMAAVIRMSRPPEPYQGKGIRYAGEYVRIKAGKTGKSGR
jgi:large subunit ribosomal protein L6